MPVNKNAYQRYLILDHCLQQRNKQYSLEDLIEQVNAILIEEKGLEKGVSKRTIQSDIQHLRTEFQAPIQVSQNKYYQYSDSKFSIRERKLNAREEDAIQEAIQLLSQMSHFSHYQAFQSSLQQLQAQFAEIHEKQKILQVEEGVNYSGIKWLQPIFQAAQNRKQIEIYYGKFQEKDPKVFLMNPYIIKEFRNRWYAVGYTTLKEIGNQPNRIFNLPFDRIKDVKVTDFCFEVDSNDPIYAHFDHVVGTTVPADEEMVEVLFRVVKDENQANYIRTKLIHSSQQECYDLEDETWVYFTIQIIPNHELNRVLLSYGKFLEVLSPNSLRTYLAEHALEMHQNYQSK